MANEQFLRLVGLVARRAADAERRAADLREIYRDPVHPTYPPARNPGPSVRAEPKESASVRCAVCHDDGSGLMFCRCKTALHASCMIEFGCPSCGERDEIGRESLQKEKQEKRNVPITPSRTTWPYDPMNVTSSDPQPDPPSIYEQVVRRQAEQPSACRTCLDGGIVPGDDPLGSLCPDCRFVPLTVEQRTRERERDANRTFVAGLVAFGLPLLLALIWRFVQ